MNSFKGTKLPFDRVIRANIGDCHATGQKPILWLRQVKILKKHLLHDKILSCFQDYVNLFVSRASK